MSSKPGYLLIGSLLASCALFASHGALATETLTYTGGNCLTLTPCAGPGFGTLPLPTVITFTDTFSAPATSSTTQDWTFQIPTGASASMTGSGVQISGGVASGSISSFQLFSSASLIPIATGTGGPFAWIILNVPLTAGPTYDLRVVANDSYTGTLSAAAVPLPASAWLMVSGLIGFAVLARRRRDEVAPA